MKIIDHETMKCVFAMRREQMGMVGWQMFVCMRNDFRVALGPHPNSDQRPDASHGSKGQKGRRLTDLRPHLPSNWVGDKPAAMA